MATTYDKASLVMIPSGVKESKLYSIKPTSGDGDFTFSRGTDTATRVNSSGLIEKERANLLTYSQDFGNAAWVAGGLSKTANTIANPLDGAVNAYTLTLNSGTSAKFLTQAATHSGVHTQSVYLKYNTHQFIQLLIGSDAGAYVNFDLVNGTFSSFGSTIDATITDVGNDWYRCTFTYNSSIGTDLYVWAVDALSSPRADSTASTGSFYVFGFQFEQSLVATDYIETTTAAVYEGITDNLPRLDYSGGASCPSLLLEPSRTNVISNSEYIDGLSKTGVSITSNETTSPEGVVNASKVAYTSGAAYIVGGSSLTTGTDYTFSGFFKADESPYVIINQAGAGAKNAFYNLLDGTHSGASGITTDMVDYGNGWYRITYTDNLLYDSIRIYMSGNGSYGNYPSVGEGFFAWGFQTEQASYPTSYIPTYGTSASRAADSCSKTGISSLIGQTEGTLYSEFTINGLANFGTALCINNAGTSESIWLTTFANGDIRAEVFSSAGGGVQASFTKSGNVVGQTYKIAIGYAANNFAFFVNGLQVGSTDTSGSVPVSMSRVDFDYTNAASFVQSALAIKQSLLFKTRLTNAELAALTTL